MADRCFEEVCAPIELRFLLDQPVNSGGIDIH